MLIRTTALVSEGLRYASTWALCHYMASPDLSYFQILGPDAVAFRKHIDQLGKPIYLIAGAVSKSGLGSFADKKPWPGKTSIWLCQNGACLAPVSRVEDLQLTL